jgi:DNA-binding response OmpR family regulator
MIRRHGRESRRPVVLLVDDDGEHRQGIARMLREHGFEVLEAPDAASALITCRVFSGPIDLLLPRPGLPGVSGTELARSASAGRPDLRILFLTLELERTGSLIDELRDTLAGSTR